MSSHCPMPKNHLLRCKLSERSPLIGDLTTFVKIWPTPNPGDVDFPSFNLLSRGSCACLPVYGSFECHPSSVTTSGRRPCLHVRLSGCADGSTQILSFLRSSFCRFWANCRFSPRSIGPCMIAITAWCALKTSTPKSSSLWRLPRTYFHIGATSKSLTPLDWRSF